MPLWPAGNLFGRNIYINLWQIFFKKIKWNLAMFLSNGNAALAILSFEGCRNPSEASKFRSKKACFPSKAKIDMLSDVYVSTRLPKLPQDPVHTTLLQPW